jgi:iron complex transport system ATP-binding protein
MRLTDTVAFRHRDFHSLSGGERQRGSLIRPGADPKVLLLDEPLTFLDIKHQLSLGELLRQSCHQGLLTVVATHDLNLAAAYSDRIVVLSKGEIVADAPPGQALQPETIRSVFEVEAALLTDSRGRTWIRYET